MGLMKETARKALPDIIFERMHRAIKSGAYKPDERLPTEHELAMEFEVSRPVVREALRRMTLGPVALENIWPLNENFARWKAGIGPCTEWQRLKQTLDQLGGVVVPSLGHVDGAGPILSVIAVAHDAVFTLPPIGDDEPVRLRPEAVIEGLNGDQVLVVPGLRYQVVLHREPASAVAKAMLAADTTIAEISDSLQLDRPVVADVVAYLAGAGFTWSSPSFSANTAE